MPELAELKIMADYINAGAKEKEFDRIFHVEKGNIPKEFSLGDGPFRLSAESNGKELTLRIYHDAALTEISVFMGMSGNWMWLPTKDWSDRNFTRLRIDSTDGNSLLLYGLYMGPKYKVGKFGTKRGPDPTKSFDEFKQNVLDSLHLKAFDKPICEALLEQKYFNGIGNYLRSTILYYLGENPFEQARTIIKKRPEILDMCRDVPMKAYALNGGQLQDWKNPFDTDYEEFLKWVFYQKGISCRDKTGRTFWFDPKWEKNCPYR